MKPVLTAAEMRQVDAAAPETTEVLIGRAGSAVAWAALRMLGGAYGRRVVVVAGPGANGADGRVAGARLRARGVRTIVLDARDCPSPLPSSDLVIDAAYGTGFHGEYAAPDAGGAPVLAVDVPSGVDADTGVAGARAVRAAATVTFAALKPGLVLGEGRARAGRVDVADIGLDVSVAHANLVEERDVAVRLPSRPQDAHKWDAGLFVLAGSGGMTGAAWLAARAGMRAGAGTVRLATPGAEASAYPPGEVVVRRLPATAWDADALEEMARTGALVLGPGLGRADTTVDAVRALLPKVAIPAVVDADGLYALGDVETAARVIGERAAPTILTPHAGEFERLTGAPVPPDRFAAVRDLARRTRAIVLLKGPTTIVGGPDGGVLAVTQGGPELATAGTGDVLSGVIGAFLARGVEPSWAAAAAAYVHGSAGRRGPRRGLVAGDVVEQLPAALSALAASP